MKAKFLSFLPKASWKPLAVCASAVVLVAGMTGCNGCASNNTQAPIVSSTGPDPADANMALVSSGGSAPQGLPTRVAGTSQSYTPQEQGESFGAPQQGYAPGQQAAAPIVQGYAQDPNAGYPNQQAYDQGYDNGQGVMQADQAPPPLPEYDQPPAPDDNDLWTPGYWGYANTGYYWVPGAWVSAPYYGALWTPGYWGFNGGHYRWSHGYWGPHVGFYGGINYGFGYIGTGYYGGYWNNNHFYYNRAISRVSPRITNVYDRQVVINNVHYTNTTNNRVSFNGGRGGVDARPRPNEVAAMHEQHVGPLPAQQQFHQQAAGNRANFFNENHGRPAQAAVAQPIAVQHIAGPAERGGFGARPGEPSPNNNPAAMQHNQEMQRNQVEQQQRNVQGQQQLQHNSALEQQRNVQDQQRNVQQGQQTQHNNALEQQRNVQEQGRNLQTQQHNNAMEQQRNVQGQQQQLQQHNNALDQQRANETVQRNALAQQHQQQQVEQQRNFQQQQQQQVQRNNATDQQRNVQEQQHNFQQQQQQHVEQQRSVQQPQQQHVEQPHVQEAPHIEQHNNNAPHVEAPHVEAPHAAPAPHPAGGGGGGEHHH